MTVKIMLDEGAYMPTRAHKTDAGVDGFIMLTVLTLNSVQTAGLR